MAKSIEPKLRKIGAYLLIIHELENKDIDLVMRALSSL